MTYEATQSLDLDRDKGYITENKDILTKKVRWDNYLKASSYLMYSIFVALLSLSFFFSKANELDLNLVSMDLINIFVGLFAVLFSIGIISWIFKGTLKKLFIVNYYIIHFLNGLFLTAILVVLSLPIFSYPTTGVSITSISEQRLLIFAIGLLAWSLVGGIALILNTYKLKGTFPNSWIKVKLSIVAIIMFPIIAFLSWVAVFQPKLKETILIVQLFTFLAGLLYIGFAFSYIRSFKESLLSDKTEQEIDKIDIFRNVSFLMILISSLTLVVLGIYKALPIWAQWSNSVIEILSIVSMGVDAIILVFYLSLIIVAKRMGEKVKANKILSTIDNSILMDFVTWLLLVKTIVIVGLSKGVDISAFMSLSSCFIAIFIVNFSTILLGVNFPNIKNTTSTIVNVVAAMAILGMALFQSTYPKQASSAIFESAEIIILTLLPLVIASSINLGVKLISYSKIKNDGIANTPEEVFESKSKKSAQKQDGLGE